MAKAIQINKGEKGKVGHSSLFKSYQQILDEDDPGHHMSSENIKNRQTWQKMGGLASMTGPKKKGSKGMSMDGLGMALTKRGSIQLDKGDNGSSGAGDGSSSGGGSKSASSAFSGPNKRGKRPTRSQVAPAPEPSSPKTTKSPPKTKGGASPKSSVV